MKGLFTGALALCWASAAAAQTSEQHFNPDLAGQSVDCSGFRHEADGSWTALKSVPIQRQNEFTELASGTVLRSGGPKISGLDVAAVLDAACPN